MIHRTVLLKFGETTTQDQMQEVVDRFKELKHYLTGIVDLQAGLNVREKNKEYQVALIVRFENKAALEAYEADPDHKAVANYINEIGKIDSIGVDIEI